MPFQCIQHRIDHCNYNYRTKILLVLARTDYANAPSIREQTHSPPLTVFVPKLLPTTPLQVQDWPAELVHLAVAVAPTLRHFTVANAGAASARTAAM